MGTENHTKTMKTIKNKSSTYWIHCNKCFCPEPPNGQGSLFYTKCSHIFCKKCLGPKCFVCEKPTKLIEINSSMPSRMLFLFCDLREFLGGMKEFMEFQWSHQLHILKSKRDIAMPLKGIYRKRDRMYNATQLLDKEAKTEQYRVMKLKQYIAKAEKYKQLKLEEMWNQSMRQLMQKRLEQQPDQRQLQQRKDRLQLLKQQHEDQRKLQQQRDEQRLQQQKEQRRLQQQEEQRRLQQQEEQRRLQQQEEQRRLQQQEEQRRLKQNQHRLEEKREKERVEDAQRLQIQQLQRELCQQKDQRRLREQQEQQQKINQQHLQKRHQLPRRFGNFFQYKPEKNQQDRFVQSFQYEEQRTAPRPSTPIAAYIDLTHNEGPSSRMGPSSFFKF